MIQSLHSKAGFTLIEMLVSLALYTIVAVIAVGTLLVLIGGNTQSSGDQAVMTSLSFALDSMTREIRTGTDYYCSTAAGATSTLINSSSTARQSCNNSSGFSFRESGTSTTNGVNNSRIAYYYSANQLWRKIGSKPAEPMVSDDIIVSSVKFFTSGVAPLHVGTDITQPTLTIIIKAQAASSSNPKPFTIQTTITQRELDI